MHRYFSLNSKLAACRALAVCSFLSLASYACAADFTLHNQQQTLVVHASDGSYEISDQGLGHAVVHARVGAQLNQHWITCSDYPQHPIVPSPFEDALGRGRQLTVQCSGLAAEPDLSYTIRLYDTMPSGNIEVTVRNSTTKNFTVQAIRPVEAMGSLYTGANESSDRVLSDSFSEDWPPLKIYDYGQAPHGVFRAVGSQMIYNRASGTALFFGALTSDRFLTIMHWKPNAAGAAQDAGTYTVDSTGTTEIQATDPESGLRRGPTKNLIELSLPLAPGDALHSESLAFATGKDYRAMLEAYGGAIRILHHSRPSSEPMLGWWSWTAFYSGITQGNTSTNAQWLAEHLKRLGYDYFHLDLGYEYARGEYATPNAAQFPQGLIPISRQVCHLGLRLGVWTAPFEVSGRAWVYEHHKDWLVHNAQGEPIQIGIGSEAGREILFVLDTTNPGAQQYLRDTYRTLTRDWGAQYIKLDFMDNTAIEGYYYRPHTTALEAERIGLKVIRDVVGEKVLLDKDGSPMLNPVGLVDEGRLSQDTGHTFLRSKEADPGIAARYYMNHNFFLADPDAFTVSKEVIEERRIEAPLTLDEAQVSISLAAVSGGMLEIGDDLPTLGSDPDRLALVENPDLLQMVKLGHSAVPLDLLTYAPQDEQPSIFLLHEDKRQTMLAVFNWTPQPRSHTFALGDLSLPASDRYRITDVFHPGEPMEVATGQLQIDQQPAHSVRLIRIIDDSVPAQPPSITADLPSAGKIGETLRFSASASASDVPALSYTWDFGDGVSAQGAVVPHTYTRAGAFQVSLTADGVDGVPFRSTQSIVIRGNEPVPAPKRYVPEP